MKERPCQRLEASRLVHPSMGGSPSGQMYGYFRVKRENCFLHIISSGYGGTTGWEHISVSMEPINANRKKLWQNGMATPSWDDMCVAKALFWNDDETVVQFHPSLTEKINTHPGVLHLWKQRDRHYELPPAELV